jgi:hypothetical protein
MYVCMCPEVFHVYVCMCVCVCMHVYVCIHVCDVKGKDGASTLPVLMYVEP